MNAEALKAYPLVNYRESFGVAETPAEYVFHRPRLYLETTIPSYLTARISRDLRIARMQRITARWWNSWRTQFDIYVSRLVIKEATKGDREAVERRMSVIERLPELPQSTQLNALQDQLIQKCGLPRRAASDAGHVALAAIHKIDFLLTWNCAHLANPQVAETIAAICRSNGYMCPVLCTPEQLLERYEHALSR
jgi:hypothetical protein